MRQIKDDRVRHRATNGLHVGRARGRKSFSGRERRWPRNSRRCPARGDTPLNGREIHLAAAAPAPRPVNNFGCACRAASAVKQSMRSVSRRIFRGSRHAQGPAPRSGTIRRRRAPPRRRPAGAARSGSRRATGRLGHLSASTAAAGRPGICTDGPPPSLPPRHARPVTSAPPAGAGSGRSRPTASNASPPSYRRRRFPRCAGCRCR